MELTVTFNFLLVGIIRLIFCEGKVGDKDIKEIVYRSLYLQFNITSNEFNEMNEVFYFCTARHHSTAL